MKSFLKFLCVVLAIVLISAILAPLLFPFLPYKFERIFNRLIMIGTLASVLALVRFRRDSLRRYGLYGPFGQSARFFLTGFLAALVTLSLLTAVKFTLGQAIGSVPDIDFWQLLRKGMILFATACLIGVIEEFFFRGFIFTTFCKQFGWNIAFSLFLTNAFYALVHFVDVQKPLIDETPTIVDSLRLTLAPFLSLRGLPEFWPGAFGLFLFGLVLSMLFLRTGSLYAAIGLHAGCVFFVKMDGLFVDFLNGRAFLYSSDKMYDGMLGWFFLIMLGWGFHFIFKVPSAHLRP